MIPDYSKRDYLLPKGCKDLIDVLKLEQKQHSESNVLPTPYPHIFPPTVPQPIKGELLVPETMIVRDIATLLKCKPFEVIANLMGLGIFAPVNQPLDFSTITKVLRIHGYIAKKIGSAN